MEARFGFAYAHPDDESFLSAALIRGLATRDGSPCCCWPAGATRARITESTAI